MARLFRIWKDVSIVKKLYFVVGIMAVLIASELVILSFAMRTLSAGRAFVGGESLWSKAQKNAIHDLYRYSMSKDDLDFQAFLGHLEVPKGDRQARTELLKPHPNLAVVRAGFAQGQNHKDDIDLLIELLQRFYWVSYIGDAVAIWTEADNLLLDLETAGKQYYAAVNAGDNDAAQVALERVKERNSTLTHLESKFSEILGEGCRWLEQMVLSILFLIVLTVEGIGLTMAFTISRQLSRGLTALESTADHYGRGDFNHFVPVDGKDEIGRLGTAVNSMGAKLKDSYANLEAKIAAAVDSRDEFLSIASHELKTPLTALHLQMQLFPRVVQKLPSTADTLKVIGMAEESLEQVRRVTALLNDLLDLTRIRIGKFEIFRESCDLNALVLDAAKQLELQAKRAGTDISISNCPEAIGMLDASRMTEVVTNIVANAIKYGNGKPIAIEVGRKDGSRGGDGSQAAIYFTVRDNGRGISEDILPKLFERFERGKTDRKISGLGLGLYISHQIVCAHGGTIDVESTVGVGSAFTVTVPV